MNRPTVTDAARIVTGLHEAGHAAIAWRLGRTVRGVGISDPNGDHLGYCLHDAGVLRGTDPASVDLLLPVRGELRDVAEVDMLIALAGAFAEDLYGHFTTGYRVRPDERWAEQAARALADASPRADELTLELRSIFGRQTVSPDEESALEQAHALAGDEAVAHLRWMRAVARRLVSQSAYVIEPLAAALLERGTLSGDEATAVMEAATRTYTGAVA